MLSVSLWCPAPWGGERLARLRWCSVKFLCGEEISRWMKGFEEISSRWMKGFETVTQLGLGGGKGDTRIPFVIGKGLGNIPYPLENRC